MTRTTHTIIKILITMLIVYVLIFSIWYSSSPIHKPASRFWDMRREGYQDNPLHDRKNNESRE